MKKTEPLIFGAAYYEEYMPCERLEQDMQMMADAGLNTIRIAESTWSTEEPTPGCFDFSHVDRVIDAAERHGIRVIVGTPTYAVPHWLAQMDPDVLVTTRDGKAKFGPRQNMDITNPTYRFYAERIIRALVSHTAGRKNVIGYQLDNETKHYGTAGEGVLRLFRQWMQEKYQTIEAVNQAFGFAYWSDSVTRFEDLPDPTGTINASYACEFARFQRQLAAEFLLWQSDIVKEYLRPGQFITHNFDYDWKTFGGSGLQDGYSWGVQPDICQWNAARALTLIGTDIYCFAQDRLTGREIAFGGDLMRSLRQDSYLVLESQAQAFKEWLPYPGQLRLMAYSHLASGACGVMYWHWHSIHNGPESYWKGLLSHDLQPNPTYEEACHIGQEFKRLSPVLTGMQKKNRIALVVSTNTLNALKWFSTDAGLSYNDVVHWVYDALYDLNLECDVIFAQQTDWEQYDLVVFPELYAVHRELLERVRAFVARGGTVLATFRSFVADEYVKIFHEPLPGGLTDVFGMTYDQWTKPVNVTVAGAEAKCWMELLRPTTAQAVAQYRHKYWGNYAAVTRNRYGKGTAWYVGTMLPPEALKDYLLSAAADAGIAPPAQRWPVIVRSGTGQNGNALHFVLNYSSEQSALSSPWSGTDLLTGCAYQKGDEMRLPDWGVLLLEEEGES